MTGAETGHAAELPPLSAHARAALLARLEASPGAFEFAQIVRLLARAYPERSAIGGFGDPSAEVVRFGVTPSLAFPPSDVRTVMTGVENASMTSTGRRRARHGMRGRSGQPFVEVNFFGLLGPAGVLPIAYTQYVAERVAVQDTAMRDFLDLFHHRLLSLFYRAWRTTRPHVAAGEGADDDALSLRLRSLLGLGGESLQQRMPFDDALLLRHVALLAPHARSANALGALLAAYLGTAVTIEEFVPAWYRLAPGTQCELGADDDTTVLGVGTVVGDAIEDPGARARVRIGPMTRALFDSLLPGTRGHAAIRELIRFVAGDAVEIEVCLVLRREDIPATQLGMQTGALGFGTWLRSRPPEHDAADTVFLV